MWRSLVIYLAIALLSLSYIHCQDNSTSSSNATAVTAGLNASDSNSSQDLLIRASKSSDEDQNNSTLSIAHVPEPTANSSEVASANTTENIDHSFKSAVSTEVVVETDVSAAETPKTAEKSAVLRDGKLQFTIGTRWDGSGLLHPSPATVELSTTESGDLRINVSAAYFNSPGPLKPPTPQICPTTPFTDLWKFEVVEAFFLNDANQYLEVEISARGRFFILLLDSERHDVLHTLPLHPQGVDIHNPCLESSGAAIDGCNKTWYASAVIPQSYVPPNVSKFNAFAIHGNTWGESKPAESDKSYESLYPVDPVATGVKEPNFHYLPAFQKIDLSEIGYKAPTDLSPVWKKAIDRGNLKFEYAINQTSDCRKAIESRDYVARIVTERLVSQRKASFHVHVEDAEHVRHVIPSDLVVEGGSSSLDTKSESVWLSYSNAKGESVRVGVNPYGAWRVLLVADDGHVLVDNNNASFGLQPDDLRCQPLTNANWDCTFNLPWSFLPPNVTHAQIVHAHAPLTLAQQSQDTFRSTRQHDDEVARFELLGAACPGFPADSIDWRGCFIDARFVVEQDNNREYSELWTRALRGSANK